jgi:hypothetical protein
MALFLAFLGFSEPVDVLQEALLDFVANHAAIELFLGFVLAGAGLLDFADQVLLLRTNAVKLFLVRRLVGGKNTLFLFDGFNFLADALDHLVDFGKVRAFAFLLFAKLLNLLTQLFALLKGRL